MPRPWTGQVIWITGASGGIGAALARALSDEGAAVVLSARSEDALRAVADGLPGPALVLPLDVTDAPAAPAAVARAVAWRGHVDVLVNNAGLSQRAFIAETDVEAGRRLMEVNFFGAATLTRALLPHLVDRGAGQIVNVTSAAAYLAAPQRAYYSASKHALRAWSETLRAELGGTGVGVTMICPGYVATDISLRALDGAGVPRGTPDPKIAQGLPPEELVARMLPAMARRAREATIGGVEIGAIYLQRFIPGAVAWVLTDRIPSVDATPLWWARRALRAVWGLAAPPRPAMAPPAHPSRNP